MQETTLEQKIKEWTNSYSNIHSEQTQNDLNYHKMQYESIIYRKII